MASTPSDIQLLDRTIRRGGGRAPGRRAGRRGRLDRRRPRADRWPPSGQVMPLPTARERRLALRLRASELVGLLEGTDPADPEAAEARGALHGPPGRVGRSAAAPRRGGPRPGPRPADVPDARPAIARPGPTCSRSRRCRPLQLLPFSTYERCPLQYAFSHVYRIPTEHDRRLLRLRLDGPAALRAVHQGAPRAPGPRRAAADRGDLEADLRGAVEARPSSATGPPRRATSAESATCSTTSGTAR